MGNIQLCKKQVAHENLLYCTGNSTQRSVVIEGKEIQKTGDIGIAYSLCSTAETNNIVNQVYSNNN